MEKYQVQSGESVNVFDVSDLNSDSGLSKSERGERIRSLIDTMLNNDQADVIVAYAPDRSDENAQGYFVNLFAEDVYFARSGYGRVTGLMLSDGSELTDVRYPVLNPVALSTEVSAQFESGSMYADANCIGLLISGDGSQ